MHHFQFTPARVRRTAEGQRFRIGQVAVRVGGTAEDLTHLLDRSYDYASARELRWHLAERFGLPVDRVDLTRQ